MKKKSEQLIRVLIIVLVLFCVSVSEGADYKLETSVIVSEEYTDNIFLEEDNEQEEYITRIRPAIKFDYESPFWQWALDYTFDYRYYAQDTIEDDETHFFDGKTDIELVRNFFFISAKDEYRRVSLDLVRDFTEESLHERQSDRNIFDGSPYFLIAPASFVKIITGYRYRNVWYEEDFGVDKEDHIGYIAIEFELSPGLKLEPGYRYVEETSDERDFNGHDGYIGLQYQYADDSRVLLKGGYGNVEFEDGDRYEAVYWNAGIYHTVETVTLVMETRRDFDENPSGDPYIVDKYLISMENKGERSKLKLSSSYYEYTNSKTEELETRSYRIRGDISFDFTKLLGTEIYGYYDYYDRELWDTNSERYLAGMSFDYEVYERYFLTLAYRYTNSYSPEIQEDNYESNRAVIGIEKIF